MTAGRSVAARAGRTLGAVLVACVALAGCSGGGGAPAAAPSTPRPSASGGYTCTPVGGTPAPCTSAQHDQEQAQLALTEDAKAVYQQLFAELAALQRAGTATPSAELTARAGGPYLAAQQAQLAKLGELKAKMTGDVRIASLQPAPGAAARGFDAALTVCVDATKARVVAGGKELKKGQLVAETVYFRRDGDALKAWDAEKLDPGAC